jgi:transmembrane sensor
LSIGQELKGKDLETQFLQRIVTHFNDPGNNEVRDEIRTWRAESAENEKYFLEIEKLWLTTSELKYYPTLDVQAATDRLAERLRLSERFKESPQLVSPFTWFLRVAAAITVLSVAWWSYTKLTGGHYLTLTTNTQVDSVKLADGSNVFVDVNTTLLYPDRIKGDERRVFLTKGNAFFNVAKDPEHPFIIDLGNSTVTVIGTSFNVLLTEKEIEVSVREGAVRFNAGEQPAATITAGKGIVYHRNSGKIDQVNAVNSNADAWLTRDLNFKDASLAEVLNSIEKMYKVDIQLEDSIANFKKFNANFHGDNLQEVLEVLEATYPINIRRSDSTLVISSTQNK